MVLEVFLVFLFRDEFSFYSRLAPGYLAPSRKIPCERMVQPPFHYFFLVAKYLKHSLGPGINSWHRFGGSSIIPFLRAVFVLLLFNTNTSRVLKLKVQVIRIMIGVVKNDPQQVDGVQAW